MLCYMFSSAFNCRHILFHISSCKKENENSSYSANDSNSQKHTARGGFFQNLPSNERGNSGSQSEAHIKTGLSPDSISGRQNYSYLLAEGITDSDHNFPAGRCQSTDPGEKSCISVNII